MSRIATIWFLIAASQVAGCSAPTAPSDAARAESPRTVRAVPVPVRPVHVRAAIHVQ
jgi:hypothetical protein